jgi:hypothetical protein
MVVRRQDACAVELAAVEQHLAETQIVHRGREAAFAAEVVRRRHRRVKLGE